MSRRSGTSVPPTYRSKLSAASLHTLSLQGGPMKPEDVAEFRRDPFHHEAVRVRIWDEGGKLPGMKTPLFRDYAPLLQRVVDRHSPPTA